MELVVLAVRAGLLPLAAIQESVPRLPAAVRTAFAEVVARSLAWHDADPTRQKMDAKVDATMDRIIAACSS